MEKGQRTQEILLGVWEQQKHRSWVDANPLRKAATSSNSVVHFYTGGDTCEVTERPRTVKVKLICKSIKNHPDAVSIFLQEPKPCEYTLTVESSIICHVIASIDEYGLPADETPIDSNNRERAATSKTSQARSVTHRSAMKAQSKRDEESENKDIEEIVSEDEEKPSRDKSKAAAHKGDKQQTTEEAQRVTAPAQTRGRKSPSSV
ncbi:endoplasmic reticulum lectin 1-like [Tropilaelaps mercedesae]|uniref:Endoplasmic reticulum lectin 1 n=1 Tax=Tropilaelaps mercedesae TaxID=418985 RepID=A0A1V9XY10_9ACAR|nr:endoplasmic reticulum lectin 1-like [Tropilaelaps mercedesae]